MKLVTDALNGIAYHDDREVPDWECRKRWGRADSVDITVVYEREDY